MVWQTAADAFTGDEIIPFPKFFPSVPDLCKIFHECSHAASQPF
jgi:hypothetical protein